MRSAEQSVSHINLNDFDLLTNTTKLQVLYCETSIKESNHTRNHSDKDLNHTRTRT